MGDNINTLNAKLNPICYFLTLLRVRLIFHVSRIRVKWIFRKWDVGAWAGSSWLRIGTGGGGF
jgi:hypothetical protein